MAVPLAGVLGCHKSPAAPSPADFDRSLPVRTETAHYTFHSAQGDSVDAVRQETWHDWAVAQLAVVPGRKIEYYKYRDRAHMKQITGRETNGWADPPGFAAHSIWPWDNHEVLHVLSALVGRPSDFFNEGLAVAMSVDPSTDRFVPMWQSQTVHAWARLYRGSNQLPRIPEVVETEAFRRLDEGVGYPVAGSFLFFLIDSRGMGPMRQFLSGENRDERRASIERRFAEAFGVDLSGAEQAWHAFLDGGQDRVPFSRLVAGREDAVVR